MIDISIDRVTSVTLTDRSFDGHDWNALLITTTDIFGHVHEQKITLFPAAKGARLRVEQPEITDSIPA